MFTEKFKKKIYIIFIFIVLFYFFFNIKNFFFYPYIELSNQVSVVDGQSYIFVENSPFILSGKVRDVTNIYINEEEVFLDTNSFFYKKLYFYKGQNKILIKLLTKGNKEITRVISVYRK